MSEPVAITDAAWDVSVSHRDEHVRLGCCMLSEQRGLSVVIYLRPDEASTLAMSLNDQVQELLHERENQCPKSQ